MNSAAKGEGVLVEDEEGSLEMWEAMMLCTGDGVVLEPFTDDSGNIQLRPRTNASLKPILLL